MLRCGLGNEDSSTRKFIFPNSNKRLRDISTTGGPHKTLHSRDAGDCWKETAAGNGLSRNRCCVMRKFNSMLRQANEFKSFKLRARDGDIGHAREFYFDDHYWTVRYLVAETGDWLSGRQVLISPFALNPADAAEQVLPVDLTKAQIEGAPSLATDQPVSRQHEMEYHSHFDWPMYWNGPYMWGPDDYPSRQPDGHLPHHALKPCKTVGNPHLRSTQAVTGYHIEALDGAIGHVEDFIIDEQTWSLRYLVVDTRNWWPGKHVLISPQWIERVSWEESKVFINLSRDIIKRSPAYTPESLNREYETELYRHYDRYEYWADEPAAKTH